MRNYFIFIFLLFSSFTVVNDDFSGKNADSSTILEDVALEEIYLNIEGNRPSKDIFVDCVKGFNQLRSKLNRARNKQLITIIDYRLSSNKKRLWVIDLNENKVLYHSLVAHGKNTGNEYARNFSNNSGSHQSSLGFYITGETYTGKHGNSLYLEGVEEGINDKAMERYIVMHGAEYVSQEFIKKNGRLGRSFGCPSVPVSISQDIIETIKNGTCLFQFYPDNEYLSSSKLLEKVS